MSSEFLSPGAIRSMSWQAFERAVMRLLSDAGYSGVRLVGQTNDKGADIVAHKAGKRWLVQVKHWRARVGVEVLDETLRALHYYRAQIPVVVGVAGFSTEAKEHQQRLLGKGIPLQLWSVLELNAMRDRAAAAPPRRWHRPHSYQETAIASLVTAFHMNHDRRALVVLATGLGKTFVAYETIRRLRQSGARCRTLVLAHTNELVYQLERAFWPFIDITDVTSVWNGHERADPFTLASSVAVFACIDSVYAHVAAGNELPQFDIVIVDECHHAGAEMYSAVLEQQHGDRSASFLVGLTATPWRADEISLESVFGPPTITVDLVAGLNNGFLANVDYRMFTDNIDWAAVRTLDGAKFTPRGLNRTIFITEWDDGVVRAVREAWAELQNPKAIVFCGTVDHAITMRDRLNAAGFCNAAALYSSSGNTRLAPYERNRILCDFHDGAIQVLCAVDIMNEGVDVPDVNLVVFQRVTHSRRIFIQQLGRGLRLAPDKDKVIVLDFVSDIRRFAAGLSLKDGLERGNSGVPARVRLNHKVSFRRVGGGDPAAETFLREWLEDVAAVEAAGEDVAILKYPPKMDELADDV